MVYLTRPEQRSLYAVNLETHEIKRLVFSLKPERLAYDDKQLFVSFSVGDHQQGATGKIAVINTDTFSQVDEVSVSVDPFGIAAKDGFIYISAYRGGAGRFISYSLTTKEQVANGGNDEFSALTTQVIIRLVLLLVSSIIKLFFLALTSQG